MSTYRVYQSGGLSVTVEADSYLIERCGAVTFVRFYPEVYQVSPNYYAVISYAPERWQLVELIQENPDRDKTD